MKSLFGLTQIDESYCKLVKKWESHQKVLQENRFDDLSRSTQKIRYNAVNDVRDFKKNLITIEASLLKVKYFMNNEDLFYKNLEDVGHTLIEIERLLVTVEDIICDHLLDSVDSSEMKNFS